MVCDIGSERMRMLYPFLNKGKIAALRRRRNYLLYKDRLKKSMDADWDQLDSEIWVCKSHSCTQGILSADSWWICRVSSMTECPYVKNSASVQDSWFILVNPRPQPFSLDVSQNTTYIVTKISGAPRVSILHIVTKPFSRDFDRSAKH